MTIKHLIPTLLVAVLGISVFTGTISAQANPNIINNIIYSVVRPTATSPNPGYEGYGNKFCKTAEAAESFLIYPLRDNRSKGLQRWRELVERGKCYIFPETKITYIERVRSFGSLKADNPRIELWKVQIHLIIGGSRTAYTAVAVLPGAESPEEGRTN